VDQAVKYLGHVECTRLRQRVLGLSEATWTSDSLRQVNFRNVHSQTQSLILIFCDEKWPDVTVSFRSGWHYLGQLVAPVMEALVAQHYPPGGRILRAMMARLPAGAVIGRHVDEHPSFAASHRIHVPLLTNPRVSFIVGNERIATEEGVAFELNNAMPHEVLNESDSPRIHFIFDYAPPAG
jgi:aspartyl/asparaginyl beta-hydroxylase (cupin superfamily)